MALCGAKTRSGEPCKRHSMAGSNRCKLHGGAAAIANKGKKYAAKPGSIYSKFLTPDEQRTLTNIELGKVDDELRLTRIRLMRALARENEFGNQYEDDTEQREPIEVDGRIVLDIEKVTTTRKVRDYSALIDKLTARIESLERTRAELAKTSPPKDAPVGRIEIEIVGGK